MVELDESRQNNKKKQNKTSGSLMSASRIRSENKKEKNTIIYNYQAK